MSLDLDPDALYAWQNRNAGALIDEPQFVVADLMSVINDTMDNHPRSLQKEIGPSQLGGCIRSVVHTLAGDTAPGNGRRTGWLATIGTAVHEWSAKAFEHHPLNQAVEQPRFLIEHRVCVGEVGGRRIEGNADLFDIDSGTVVDWKVVGTQRLNWYRDHGPGQQYRVQAHCYGRGFVDLGYVVHNVMIVFLPREKELQHYWMWSEPYTESVALDALSRVKGVLDLLELMGSSYDLAALYPPCGSYWCPWCTGK